jgi:hypothetical protein
VVSTDKAPIRPTPLRVSSVPPHAPESTSKPSAPPVETAAPRPSAAPAPVVVRPSRAPSSPPPRDWWVYQPDGKHIGPLSTESLARACLEDKVPRNAYVGATGESSWWPLAPTIELLLAARALEDHPPPG